MRIRYTRGFLINSEYMVHSCCLALLSLSLSLSTSLGLSLSLSHYISRSLFLPLSLSLCLSIFLSISLSVSFFSSLSHTHKQTRTLSFHLYASIHLSYFSMNLFIYRLSAYYSQLDEHLSLLGALAFLSVYDFALARVYVHITWRAFEQCALITKESWL